MNPKPGNDCNIVAINDEFIFSLKDLQNSSYVDVDPLRNDFLCAGTIKLSKVIPYGNANPNFIVATGNLLRYIPSGGKFGREDVQCKYEITDEKGRKALALLKIKFVD